jgi:hypothetical protein
MPVDVATYRASDEGADWYSKGTRITTRLRVARLLPPEEAQQPTNRGTGNGPDDHLVVLGHLQSNFPDLIAHKHKSSSHLPDVFIASKL